MSAQGSQQIYRILHLCNTAKSLYIFPKVQRIGLFGGSLTSAGGLSCCLCLVRLLLLSVLEFSQLLLLCRRGCSGCCFLGIRFDWRGTGICLSLPQ